MVLSIFLGSKYFKVFAREGLTEKQNDEDGDDDTGMIPIKELFLFLTRSWFGYLGMVAIRTRPWATSKTTPRVV